MSYYGQQASAAVALARRAQGLVEGKLAVLGVSQREALAAEAWTQNAVSPAAMEGQPLDLTAVRSSAAQRLGMGPRTNQKIPRHVYESLGPTPRTTASQNRQPKTRAPSH